MLIDFKGGAEIKKQEWDYRYKFKGCPTTINLSPYQIHYIRNGQAYAQVAISKKAKFFYINGLISFKKAHGQNLIRNMLKTLPDYKCRINCLGSALFIKYKQLGFKVTYTCDNYYEMEVTNEDFIKEDRCFNCTRQYESKCLLQSSKEVDVYNNTCEFFYNVLFTDEYYYRRGKVIAKENI